MSTFIKKNLQNWKILSTFAKEKKRKNKNMYTLKNRIN